MDILHFILTFVGLAMGFIVGWIAKPNREVVKEVPARLPPNSVVMPARRYQVKIGEEVIYNGQDVSEAKRIREAFRGRGKLADLYVDGVWRG